ncbi:MAG: hypothetical protein K2X35_26140 [Bryobacteraceae bacterium]|nr:hypothetical protein [Bryobacteraceae bacterium]
MADFALADNVDTLRREHPFNARLAAQGLGQVPNLAGVDLENLSATMTCAAMAAILTVPMGWHVLDDHQRVLIFDPDQTRQIEMKLVDSEGRTNEEILENIAAQIAGYYPECKWATMDLGGMPTLAVRGIPLLGDDGQTTVYLDQVFLYKARERSPGWFAEVRVTMAPEDTVKTLDMVELILQSIHWVG